MSFIPGPVDINRVPGMTTAELAAELARLAENYRLSGAEYTGVVMKRAAEELTRKDST